MKNLKERLSNSKLRKYFSFFEFYYYVAKRSPKQYSIAHGNTINYLAVLMTPLVLWLLVMNWFLLTGSGFALIAFLTFGIALILNLVFTRSVISEAREIERKINEERIRLREEEEERIRYEKLLQEREKLRQYYENLKRIHEEETRRRAEQQREKSKSATMNQISQLYSVLGINPTTNITTVKKAYRQKAKQHHPDKGGDELSFTKVNKAYEMILKIIERNNSTN